MELAVAIPQTSVGVVPDAGRIRQFLSRVETLGFRSAWAVEQVLGRIPSLEPLGVLSYAAAVTSRLRLGTAVILPALRSPVHLAKSIATLDHLSGGRLIVGVGLGGHPEIYPAFGISAETRVARFAEAIEVMKRLWTESSVTSSGRFWKLEGARMEPRPLQVPHPPIWFGGHHQNALRRAVELGDGFIGAGSMSIAGFAEEVAQLRRLLAERSRSPESFPIGKRVYFAIDPDRERAARRLREWFGLYYGKPELVEQVAVYGEPQKVLDDVARIVTAGARLLLLNPVFDELAQIERFAAEIAPGLPGGPPSTLASPRRIG